MLDCVPCVLVRTEQHPAGYLRACAAGEEPTKFINPRGTVSQRMTSKRNVIRAITNTVRIFPETKPRFQLKAIMEVPTQAKITVTHGEALAIAGHLKVSSRKMQDAADVGCTVDQAAIMLKEHAALFDSFADKLYAPFLTREMMIRLDELADKSLPETPKL